jgi:hypothetical protein
LRVEYRLGVFGNRVLRKMFGLKRGEIADWSRLHNELHNFTPYQIYLGDKLKSNERVGHMACLVGRRVACRVLWKKPEGKRPYESHRHR